MLRRPFVPAVLIAALVALLQTGALAAGAHVTARLQLLRGASVAAGYLPVGEVAPRLIPRNSAFAEPLALPEAGRYAIGIVGCDDAGPLLVGITDQDGEVLAADVGFRAGVVELEVTEPQVVILTVVAGESSRQGERSYHLGASVFYRPLSASSGSTPRRSGGGQTEDANPVRLIGDTL